MYLIHLAFLLLFIIQVYIIARSMPFFLYVSTLTILRRYLVFKSEE